MKKLKLNIQKTKIITSGPISSWQIDGETVIDFILGGSKITADGDCSHEIKRRLLLGRKVMTNLDSILKSRDITLPTKVHLVKVMVFPVVMYGCESWTIKKAERWRIDAFEELMLKKAWRQRSCFQKDLWRLWHMQIKLILLLQKLTPHCQTSAILMSLKHVNSLLLSQGIWNG